ncbi:hypothetical protein DPMN_092191 [Dreissena polymorpha]|uniref:Uncharacterized protein n=1 Tax=Dreissena polymorpha TaxID=45954 RepID=A0A9D4L0V0_DREPO|nr:hypothetical protein DPMN_092191 [Dreissena polymorpha]
MKGCQPDPEQCTDLSGETHGTTARKNTTVLRIPTNLRWNRWMSIQEQNMILVARAVVQTTD